MSILYLIRVLICIRLEDLNTFCRALPRTMHWRCPHAYRLEGRTDTRTHAQEDVITHVGRVGGTRLEEWGRGAPGGVLRLLSRVLRVAESRVKSTKSVPPCFPWKRPKAGVFCRRLACMIWGRLGKGSKPKPDEGVAYGCLGAGDGPGSMWLGYPL